MAVQKRATVVLASRNRPTELAACLTTLQAAIGPDDEIIVIDSASDDPEAVRQVAASMNVRCVRVATRGSAKARNIGVREAAGAVIAFIDDDARVEEGWLDALAAPFSDPEIAVVVGPVFVSGSQPPRLLAIFKDFNAARDSARFSRTSADWFERLHFGAIGSGANVAVRRSAFEAYGFFREGLGAGAPISGDETYFFLSVVEQGGVIVNEPAARAFHPVQNGRRLRSLARSRIAYVLYVFLTRPKLRPAIVAHFKRRSPSGGDGAASGDNSLGELLVGVLIAPALVAAARLADRRQR